MNRFYIVRKIALESDFTKEGKIDGESDFTKEGKNASLIENTKENLLT
ncbi:hypothetical protein [uncultured Fenollaria sp.]|nr:hypothetical protein [uncultured Fenollaria sp.]